MAASRVSESEVKSESAPEPEPESASVPGSVACFAVHCSNMWAGREDAGFVWASSYIACLGKMTSQAAGMLRTLPLGAVFNAHIDSVGISGVPTHTVARMLNIPATGNFWITRRDRGSIPIGAYYGDMLAFFAHVAADVARSAAAPPEPLFTPAVEAFIATQGGISHGNRVYRSRSLRGGLSREWRKSVSIALRSQR